MPLPFGTSPIQLALLVLLLPLASAALITIALRRQGNIAALFSTLVSVAIVAGALTLAFSGVRITEPSFVEWLRLGDFSLALGFRFDDLAALMLSIVGIVGVCVHVFSLGYMSDDGAKARYFGGLSIFMFSMTGIVLADNLFMIFIFWELVGFSSWLLIAHFCDRQSAADASKKAFIANRVGDFGFLLGIIACHAVFGTVNLSQLAALANGGAAVAAFIPMLLFCGAIGKSAQLPLHVWLPDAMEGPTPVSALIHAATMVAAGIYMLCRIEPLFAAAPDALDIVMWIGTATALYAALCALTQRDIKKVLAYSTLSQLGYMVAAFGLGRIIDPEAPAGQTVLLAGVGAAMFHLTTHAFFKALMFLGSGSVIHGCHHEQDIFKMGGLAKKMPVTFITFTIGVLAIAGLPFISGFYSKDAILHLAQEKSQPVFLILLVTAVLTAFYMVRMWKLVFLGSTRSHASEHAHESGLSMTVPLLVLAVLSVVGGWTTGKVGALIYGSHFDGVWSQIPHAHGLGVVLMSVAILVLGAGLALAFYKNAPTDTLEKKARPVFTLLVALKNSFDGVYNYYVGKVQQRFALLLNGAEMLLLSGLIIRGLAGTTGLFGLAARALHTGSLHAYVYWFLIGAALFWAIAGGLF
ncbi:MAG: NADH-quinone oxidoreductase subunit L [Opitutaceae bacterium]|nr:NADH-quinone oxidoreductase subunit L [Opitutaceae bacterium]